MNLLFIRKSIPPTSQGKSGLQLKLETHFPSNGARCRSSSSRLSVRRLVIASSKESYVPEKILDCVEDTRLPLLLRLITWRSVSDHLPWAECGLSNVSHTLGYRRKHLHKEQQRGFTVPRVVPGPRAGGQYRKRRDAGKRAWCHLCL